MKVSVVYSSKTGCTKKLAEALYAGLPAYCEKQLADIKENPDVSSADVLVFGYWVNEGGLNEDAKKWFSQISGKKVFLFATLSFNVDSEHGFQSGWSAVQFAQEHGNEVIGHFVGNGRLDPALIERFKKMAAEGSNNHHAFTPEKGIRYEIMSVHPTPAEMALASERLNERLEMQRRIAELKK